MLYSTPIVMLLYRLNEPHLNAVLLLPCDLFYKLCQHPERLIIMSEVARRSLSFSELQEKVQIPKSTLHKHVRALVLGGWIQVERVRRRCMIKPSALVYIGFRIEDSSLTITRENLAVIFPHCGAFLLRVDRKPTFTTCSGDSCSRKSECLRCLSRLSKKVGIDPGYEEIPEVILDVFSEIAFQEIKNTLSMQHISIPISRSKILYRELLMSGLT